MRSGSLNFLFQVALHTYPPWEHLNTCLDVDDVALLGGDRSLVLVSNSGLKDEGLGWLIDSGLVGRQVFSGEVSRGEKMTL